MRKLVLFVAAAAFATTVLGALPSNFVGRDTCATCHEDAAKAFAAGAHGRAISARGGDLAERACESCHGPGRTHADDPKKTNIRGLKDARADRDQACVTCHAAQQGGLAMRTPRHERAGITCLDCHVSGHTKPAAEPLLARATGALCGGCHASQVAQFSLPFAHRQGRTPVPCTDCHSVHGGTSVAGHVVEDGQERCVACHAEKAGPWVYAHPPNGVNGCVGCHQPHGSPNPRLLKRSDVTNLCLECHTSTPTFHDLTKSQFRQCQTCHAAVHGSQRDAKLFRE